MAATSKDQMPDWDLCPPMEGARRRVCRDPTPNICAASPTSTRFPTDDFVPLTSSRTSACPTSDTGRAWSAAAFKTATSWSSRGDGAMPSVRCASLMPRTISRYASIAAAPRIAAVSPRSCAGGDTGKSTEITGPPPCAEPQAERQPTHLPAPGVHRRTASTQPGPDRRRIQARRPLARMSLRTAIDGTARDSCRAWAPRLPAVRRSWPSDGCGRSIADVRVASSCDHTLAEWLRCQAGTALPCTTCRRVHNFSSHARRES